MEEVSQTTKRGTEINYIQDFKLFMDKHELTKEQEMQLIQLIMNKHYHKCGKCNWCKRNKTENKGETNE
jgi:hypothetical protein